MFGLDMLDVAIGIGFVYLLVSLLCSAIVESAEALLKRRSSDLERGIGELLRDPNLLSRFYNHPLINGLYKGTYKPGMRDLPSYIPSRSFSLAIMDLLISPDPSQHKGVTGAAAGPRAGTAVSTAALAERMTDDPAADQARHAVLTLVNAAGGDAQKTRENIEFWFDTAMDRVSGGYKRRAQRALFVIGLLVAVALNIDTVRILRELMTNKQKRAAIVTLATNYAKQPGGSLAADVDAVHGELDRLGLPLGWASCRKCTQRVKIFDRCWQICWKQNLGAAGGLTIIGWLLTAFAVCLGAPFWFDLLNKFMVVRSTVKPREKSGTEGPKEPQAPPPSQ